METKLTLFDVPEVLENDLRIALDESKLAYQASWIPDVAQSIDDIFQSEMADVIHGIERAERFLLLKRFIVHGSRLPRGEARFKNSEDPLTDRELSSCTQSGPKLPVIPEQSCHPFRTKVASHSGPKLPLFKA